jgi:putative transposase
MGADMDREAAKKVHKESRKALAIIESKRQDIDPETRQTAMREYSKLIIGWQQFLDDVNEAVDTYNNTRHSGLPKIRDPHSGRMRHPTPNEYWAQFEATGFKPFMLEEGETDDLFRPYVKRRANRCLIELHTNKYFSLDLEAWDGQDVLVGYDIHNADKVWVRELEYVDGEIAPGPAICMAEFGGNEQRYMPVTAQQLADEKRAREAIKRKEKNIETIKAGAQPQLDAHQTVALNDPVPAMEPTNVQPDIEDAVVVDGSAAIGGARPIPSWNPRNPSGDPDIDLAWQILDAPEGTEIPKGHRQLMRDLLNNKAAITMLKDCELPIATLEKRLSTAAVKGKNNDEGDDN